jgi:xanthine dehydrogenase accessory factor
VREILAETLELLEAGQEFVLVSLTAERGSTPRAAGAEMLVRRDGSIAGTIGGGLLEHVMLRAAADVLRTRRSTVTDMTLGGTDVRSEGEMLCGGAAEVLLTYVPAGDAALREVCAAIKQARAARRRAWYFTFLPAAGAPVEHCLLDAGGGVTGAAPCAPQALRTTAAKAAVHGLAEAPDGRSVLVEPLAPRSAVVICGGGHVGKALAPAALAAGFDVTVVDDREEFADRVRFPGADVLLAPFDGALARLAVDEQGFVVIVTKGHAHDMVVLTQALRTPAAYIGMMASRGKWSRIAAALEEDGFSAADIARVHSPIGLEIGAETPAELAVSIVAEMIKVRAGHTA